MAENVKRHFKVVNTAGLTKVGGGYAKVCQLTEGLEGADRDDPHSLVLVEGKYT